MKNGIVPAERTRDAELRRVLVETVMRLPKPSSAAEVRKALPKPYQRPAAEIAHGLAELAEAQSLFVVPAGKALKYTHRDPDQTVRDTLVAALRGKPLSASELKTLVKEASPGLENRTATALDALVARGEIYQHPKSKKESLKYALDPPPPPPPPDPTPFLNSALKAVQAVQKKLAPHGVTLPAVYAALGRALGIEAAPPLPSSPLEDEASVLEMVRELAAREPPGTLLSVRALRAAQPLDKARFDRAVLSLSAAGKVMLHHHDFPASLPPVERAGLVEDSRGIHYIGIALRRDP